MFLAYVATNNLVLSYVVTLPCVCLQIVIRTAVVAAVTTVEAEVTVAGGAAADTVEVAGTVQAVEATVDATATLPRNERATGDSLLLFFRRGGGVAAMVVVVFKRFRRKRNKRNKNKNKSFLVTAPLDWLVVSLKSALFCRLPYIQAVVCLQSQGRK